jgi:16S rRNA (adenine1518-N6/adenine1519-N6)-dimethyltransferase
VKRARKRFGQHFLEPVWAVKLVDAIAPQPDDVFVEIGPGRGALTVPLAARSRAVIAFEIDRDLAAELRATVPSNVEIVEGDFLARASTYFSGQTDPSRRISVDRMRAAANLPYNVASPILFELIRLFDAGVAFADATLMLQREVADRLLANPGSKEYGVLTVLVGHSATAKRLFDLPPGAFRPQPKVRSTMVRLQFHPGEPPVRDRSLFASLVQSVFTQRRKTMLNALRAFEPARDRRLPTWLDPRRRPETLSIGEFARLADDLAT